MRQKPILYGIKNCDTVRRAVQWLNDAKVEFEFHDYKSKGITASKLEAWSEKTGWESLLNKKGMTWKQLPEKTKDSINDQSAAIRLMVEKPTVIKRPVIEAAGHVLLGFDEALYRQVF